MSRRDLTGSYDALEAVDNLRKMRKENPLPAPCADPLASLSPDVLLTDLSACCVDRRLVEFNDRLVEVRRRFLVLQQEKDEAEKLADVNNLTAAHALDRAESAERDLAAAREAMTLALANLDDAGPGCFGGMLNAASILRAALGGDQKEGNDE